MLAQACALQAGALRLRPLDRTASAMSARPPPAFGQALIASLPALRRYATALSGQAALADDLVQDCIERALVRFEQLEDLARIGAWLRAIIYNLYMDELRRRRARGTGVDVEDIANDLAFSTQPQDGTAMMELSRATARLSPEHRQIIMLAGVEALSYRDIATEIGVPIGTVMSRLARARAALRSLLEGTPAAMDARA
jgi:RNA polymerase sigma-70 factor, ECF subfamily